MALSWYRSVFLEEGERARIDAPANDYRGWRAVGGRLVVTDRRVIFEPNWLDFIAAARGWRIALDQVLSVDVVPGQRSINPHKVRTRVRIQIAGRKPIMVLVSEPEALAAALLKDH